MNTEAVWHRFSPVVFILAFASLGCGGGSIMPPAGALPVISASDFPAGAPPVQIAWPYAEVNTFLQQSTYQVSLSHSRKDANELEIGGKYVPPRPPYTDDQKINLKDLGFHEADLPTLKLYWVNADGSRTPLQPATAISVDPPETNEGA